MRITPIKTRILTPPKDDMKAVIKESVKELPEGSVLVVTSKIVAISQGRCVRRGETEKDALVAKEAEKYMPRDTFDGVPIPRTIKQGILGTASGIDASNSDGYFTLLPESPHKTAEELWQWLRSEYGVNDVGVLFTDSRSLPFRRGSTGISYGFFGFVPVKDYRHEHDIFDQEIHVSQSNIADGLAAAAVVVMGEGNESTPLAIITDIPGIEFSDKPFRPSGDWSSFYIPFEEDTFYPYLKDMPWEEGEGKHEDI